MSGPSDAPVIVGRITAALGVKGWVKVASFTDPAENLLDYRPWLIREGDRWRPVEVDETQRRNKGFVARLDGCHDRDGAEALIRRDLAVPRAVLPPPEPDEYYWFDLVGLDVVTTGGEALGSVVRLMPTGANDVLVVQGEDRERLIPFTHEAVPEVDLGARRITVDWDPAF
jgi:16S rRNA processing protein RimM